MMRRRICNSTYMERIIQTLSTLYFLLSKKKNLLYFYFHESGNTQIHSKSTEDSTGPPLAFPGWSKCGFFMKSQKVIRNPLWVRLPYMPLYFYYHESGNTQIHRKSTDVWLLNMATVHPSTCIAKMDMFAKEWRKIDPV